ncbi:MAG TPA: hypothetical protein VK619_10465 [Pyrinomonadaceae bacterium]|nr:hypothetical protein [Pyrinomonadaceae bacterium]
MHAGVREADLCHPAADATAQQADQNLIDDERGEQFSVRRVRRHLDQPRRGVDYSSVGPTDIHGAALLNLRQTVWIHLQGKLGDPVLV